tara:strand:+ start:26776 stop:28944 length:2169 start_codon:yes stop_codon:yes gene_type:complete
MANSVYKKPFLKQQAEYLSDAWDAFADQDLKQAAKSLVSLGGNTLYFGMNGVGAVINSELGQDNLKTSEKIIPKILLLASIPITVSAALVTVVGVSILAPPFAFAASIAGVMRSSSAFINDKRSLDNLNRQLITTDKINSIISKAKLSVEDKNVVGVYIEQPKKIYEGLYQLRQYIIKDEQLTSDQKNKLIQQINDKIEGCFNGDYSPITMTLEDMPVEAKESIEAKVERLNINIKDYCRAEENYHKLNIPKNIAKKIKNHKATHEHIYAQDIPSITKQKMVEMISKPKLKQSDIDGVNAQLANHFINQKSTAQQSMLDQTLAKFVSQKHSELSINEVGFYLESPRLLYKNIEEIHQKIPQEHRADYKEKILEKIEKVPSLISHSASGGTTDVMGMMESFFEEYKIPRSIVSQEMDKIKTFKEHQDNLAKKFDNIVDVSDMQAMSAHQQAMLIQHIENRGVEVHPPNVSDKSFLNKPAEQKILPKNLQERADNIKEKVTKPFVRSFSSMKKRCQDKIYGKEKSDEIAKMSKEQDTVSAEFKQQFSGSHKLLKQVQERNFLKKAVPRRVLGIGMSLANTVLSGLASFALPAIFTPAAPAGVAVSVGVGVMSAGLTIGSVANSASLLAEHGLSYQKVSGSKGKAFKGVTPDVGQEKKDLAALRETMKKFDKKESALPDSDIIKGEKQSKAVVFKLSSQQDSKHSEKPYSESENKAENKSRTRLR